ncbi:MAG TPA: GntR family transcriptional regulator [Lacisediminihabitans sp.]|uniref:GntR family transcriptional regulator n=1 Tax=Lacisediminihabitans sp. TaxID=2787631 RepID=UPI002ED863EF
MTSNPTLSSDTESAAEHAYLHTKSSIVRGELAGGTAISENVICHELGISRTPVHEAFLRLAAEELITLESRKGAIVRPISPSEAEDVVEMREAVESAAAARIIRSGFQDDLAPVLAGLLERQAEYVAAGDVDAFVDADDDFHTAIVVASRNSIAMHFTRLIRDRQQRLRHQLMRMRSEHLAASLDEHRALAEALASEDAAAYAEVLGRHVDRIRGML